VRERFDEVCLAGAGSGGDRLQHLRALLPCEVRVTAASHPLFGRLLVARDFRRVDGVVFLVVGLPDGSPGTIRLDATDVLGEVVTGQPMAVVDVDGVRALRTLVTRLSASGRAPTDAGDGK
jgi:hypothetical protein